jgi:predicted nucleic acid-binding protein
MTVLVIDASVWAAAADATDPFSDASRRFLEAVAAAPLPIALPALARIEVACALARRLRDAEERVARGSPARGAPGGRRGRAFIVMGRGGHYNRRHARPPCSRPTSPVIS